MPCIAFDQPLWLKATEIVTAKSMNIVCRLGGFHTMMSFLGSIGSMMKGSRLEEALETVYGPYAVAHMMTGKAFSRALRGHFLVEAALVNKLMAAIVPQTVAGKEDGYLTDEEQATEGRLNNEDVKTLRELYDGTMNKSIPVSSIAESIELNKLKQCIAKQKENLSANSSTANLWLQYIEYVEVLKLFIALKEQGIGTYI